MSIVKLLLILAGLTRLQKRGLVARKEMETEEGKRKRKMQEEDDAKRMMRWLVARKETEEGRRNTHLKKRKKMAVEMMKRMMGRMVSHTLRGRSKCWK